MTRQTIYNYITIRYDRWLDYAKYQCERQGVPDEAVDVLNEVLENVLHKDEGIIMGLYDRKSKQYRELDYFILRMISTYSSSDTAPYRHKYHNRSRQEDNNVKLSQLELIDEEYRERDRPAELLREMKLVRWVFAGLHLTSFERDVFDWVFIQGETVKSWSGLGHTKSVYRTFNTVRDAISMVLYALGLSRKFPKSMNKRSNELATEFYRKHKVVLKQKKDSFYTLNHETHSKTNQFL